MVANTNSKPAEEDSVKRTVATAMAVTAAVATLGGAAQANHKKPIEKTYSVTAPAPDPTNYAAGSYSVCAQTVPGSFHVEEFAAPEAGTMKVTMTGFQGDWDLLMTDDKGRELSAGGSSDLGGTETMSYKAKKAGTLNVIACNWAGSPTATVKYVFTFK